MVSESTYPPFPLPPSPYKGMLFTIGVNWRELTFELTRNFLGWVSPASPASGRPPCTISPESKKQTLVSPPSPLARGFWRIKLHMALIAIYILFGTASILESWEQKVR